MKIFNVSKDLTTHSLVIAATAKKKEEIQWLQKFSLSLETSRHKWCVMTLFNN
jgi:hypothetical protein